MPELHRCATCGNVLSESLGGQCPACLLKGGIVAARNDAPGMETALYEGVSTANGAARTAALPMPGQSFGAYQIVRALGQGGMGSVFEAEEQETGRRLALKVLNHSLDSPDARQRFFREGRLMAEVNHPQSVYVFGAQEIEGAPVITMELVQGGTLQERVKRHGPMPIQEAVDAILQIIDGLKAAQEKGVLHRDVKPANCFVDADGRVKVGDFGLSISKAGRGDLQLTSSGVFLGTPTFASPEQLRGDELDARSDQYAVGVTLYYLLTGQVPFEAPTMVQLVAKVLEKPAPDVRGLRPEVPRELAAVIQSSLAKEPNRRYRTYADFRAALLPFSSMLPSPASPFRRFAAECIDKGATFAVNSLVTFLAGLFGYRIGFGTQGAWTLEPMMWGIGFCIYVLYYVLPEGLAGATIGKRLLGLRVVREGQRQPPGVLRAGVRSLLFNYLPMLPFGLFLLAFPEMLERDGALRFTGSMLLWFMLAGLGFYVVLGLLFVTMRRGNGYAAIHDLVSGCRVVVRPTATNRPALLTREESVDKPQAGVASIGPYHLLATLGSTSAGAWHLGYDPRLFRRVWLCVVPAETPKVSAARQNVARPGRLRWLAGRRGQQNWDAYEAPTGQALWTLLDRPHDWSHVRYWLLDLAEELTPALKDGTLPETLGLESVWITADGRAILLDHGVPGLEPSAAQSADMRSGDVEPAKGFLHQVAVASLNGRRVGFLEAQAETVTMPVPLHARPIVDGLIKVQRLEVAAAQIQAVLDKPTRVTKTRRASLLACCVGIPLAMVLILGAQLAMMQSTRNTAPELVDLKIAIEWHTPVFDALKPNEAEVKALETYLAGSQRERIEDPETWKSSHLASLTQHQQQSAKDIVARTHPPTDEELKEATAIVRPILEARRANLNSLRLEVLLLIWFAAALWMYVAFPSLVCALLFRGGLLWRIFGISAVNKVGQPAGRWRILWRNLIAWSPVVLAPIALAMLVPLINEPLMIAIIMCVAYAAAALASTFIGSRSWPDRLAGTWLVMR